MTARPKKLSELLVGLERFEIRGDPHVPIRTLVRAPLKPQLGALYACEPRMGIGRLAGNAVSGGAAALLVQRWLPLDTTQVLVPAVLPAVGPIAAQFHGRPTDRLAVIAVTGTNGKTTTTYLLEAILRSAGIRVGLIGTMGARLDGKAFVETWQTTPEPPLLHRIFADMVRDGAGMVVTEVSSHAMDRHRVDGVMHEHAVFTNLSKAHLAYHGDVDAYFAAKARLFTPEMTRQAVINVDSPAGRRLLRPDLPNTTYGMEDHGDVRACDVEDGDYGISFRVNGQTVRSSLRGRFNVSNCLAALAVARSLGIGDDVAAAGIGTVERVPGRMEVFASGHGFQIIDDTYNANPGSMAVGLAAARRLARSGCLVAVLGGMAELGAFSPQEHDRIGRIAVGIGVDRLVTVGSEASRIANSALDRGMSPDAVAICQSREEALTDVLDRARPGDTVYLKASRVAGLEQLGARLR